MMAKFATEIFWLSSQTSLNVVHLDLLFDLLTVRLSVTLSHLYSGLSYGGKILHGDYSG